MPEKKQEEILHIYRTNKVVLLSFENSGGGGQ